MRIAVLDDRKILARALARCLTRHTGAQVDILHSAPALMVHVTPHSCPFELVILDFDLGPGPDGVSALVGLRSHGVRVPCAFYTASPSATLAARLVDAGVTERTAYFRKPTDTRALTAWVRDQLSFAGGS